MVTKKNTSTKSPKNDKVKTLPLKRETIKDLGGHEEKKIKGGGGAGGGVVQSRVV